MDSYLIFELHWGLKEGESISCSAPGANTEGIVHRKGSWRERERDGERERERERGKNTKLKEIKSMLCKIVTAVFVFIGCFFWLHFFLATVVHMSRKAI